VDEYPSETLTLIIPANRVAGVSPHQFNGPPPILSR
jgi:hypothetical protein